MLREWVESRQTGYGIVLPDELAPQKHLLRKMDKAVDFRFIHELCKPLRGANNGRPAIEPKLPFRMLPGYLHGVRSEVRPADAVKEDIAFKRFPRLKRTEKGPDHATIRIRRVRRFRNSNIAEQIFNEILRQCMAKGLVGGRIQYTGSTHIKARANKHRKVLVSVEETPREYIGELNLLLASKVKWQVDST